MSQKAGKVPMEAGPLQTCSPVVPNSVIREICASAGFETNDVRVLQSIGLATQAFMTNIMDSAMSHCKVRLRSTPSKSDEPDQPSEDSKLALTMEDLSPALNDHGIICQRLPFIA